MGKFTGIDQVESTDVIEKSQELGIELGDLKKLATEAAKIFNNSQTLELIVKSPGGTDSRRLRSFMKLGLDEETDLVIDSLEQIPKYSVLVDSEIMKGLIYVTEHSRIKQSVDVLNRALSNNEIDFSNQPPEASANISHLLQALAYKKEFVDTILDLYPLLEEKGLNLRYFFDATKSILEESPTSENIQKTFQLIKHVDVFNTHNSYDESAARGWATLLHKTCKRGNTNEVFNYMEQVSTSESINYFTGFEKNEFIWNYFFQEIEPGRVKQLINKNVESILGNMEKLKDSSLSDEKEKEKEEKMARTASTWFLTLQIGATTRPDDYAADFKESLVSLASGLESLLAKMHPDINKHNIALSYVMNNNFAYYQNLTKHNNNYSATLANTLISAFNVSRSDLIEFTKSVERPVPIILPYQVETREKSVERVDEEYYKYLRTALGENTAAQTLQRMDELTKDLGYEDLYFLRKFIERYGLLSDEVTSLLSNPYGHHKLEINKSGSKLEIVAGGLYHGLIIRTQKTECNDAWEKAASISPYIGIGEDNYLAVEPIIRRVRNQNVSASGDEDVVYTRFCGLTLSRIPDAITKEVNITPKYAEKAEQLLRIINTKRENSVKIISANGVDHGHLHKENFTVEFVRKNYLVKKVENDTVSFKDINRELNYDPENISFEPKVWLENPDDWEIVVRIIDFDRAEIAAKEDN